MKARNCFFSIFIVAAMFLVGCGSSGGSSSNPVASTVAGVSVRGRVAGTGDMSGIPVYLLGVDAQVPPTANLRAATAQNIAGQLYFSMTNSTGEFTFQNVIPGNYNVVAKKDQNHGTVRRNFNVSANASVLPTDLELLLTATGDVSGQIQVPADFTSSSGIIAFLPGTSFSAFTDSEGKFSISGVPVGTYTVSFTATGLEQAKVDNISIGAGKTTSLPLVSLSKDSSFFAGIIWKGELNAAPAEPKDNWAYYNSADKKAYIYYSGAWYILAKDGQNGAQGTAGISVVWKGPLAAAPASPETNWAYYDTVQKKSLIWDGDSWETLAIDGLVGPQGPIGPQGPKGDSGISIVWKGSLGAAPASPETNWAYYDTVQKKSLIWDGDSWETLAIDGLVGPQGPIGPQGPKGDSGISIVWKGSLGAAPASPETNWAYYDTVQKKSLIWDGDTWETLAIDGATGPQGAQGAAGISVVWKGSLGAAPGSPQTNWAYYDTAQKKALIWDGDTWETLAIDGATGPQGSGIVWKGSLASNPSSPQLNWAYYNTNDKKSYIYDGSSWQTLAVDGSSTGGATVSFTNAAGPIACFPPLSTEVTVVSTTLSVTAGDELVIISALEQVPNTTANWAITYECRLYRDATLIHSRSINRSGSIAGNQTFNNSIVFTDTAPATTAATTYNVRFIVTSATNIISSSTGNNINLVIQNFGQ